MSPRAVEKRARPGNEGHHVQTVAPETPTAIGALEAADHSPAEIDHEPAEARLCSEVVRSGA